MYPRVPCHQDVTFEFSRWFQQWSHGLNDRWCTNNSMTKNLPKGVFIASIKNTPLPSKLKSFILCYLPHNDRKWITNNIG